MAGSLFESGAGKFVILLPFMLKSPAIFTASLICMADESPEDIELTLISLLPVMVTVSLTTVVVILLLPVNFRVSAVLIVEPEESSPTNVMPAKELELVKLNIPEPLVANT